LTIVRDAQAQDAYVDKLAKILPAELTATYFLIRTLAGQAPHLTPYLLLMALALCAVFYVVAPNLINMTLPLNRLLYCLTFVTWFLAIDPARFGADLFLLNEQHLDLRIRRIGHRRDLELRRPASVANAGAAPASTAPTLAAVTVR
jgi:hypothetical protein